jgi:signal transduction histidine kinase
MSDHRKVVYEEHGGRRGAMMRTDRRRPLQGSVTPAIDSAESLARRCHEAEQRASHLDRANRELSRFAAAMAHDLRSPLQVVAGFAQLLVRRDVQGLDEDSRRGLAAIVAAVNDMAEIIDSALAEASPEVGYRRPGPVDCAEVALRAIQRVKTQIDAADAVVEVGDLPIVHGEGTQLGRVFQNLLSNAVKAAVPGRTLRVGIEARCVRTGWEISVTDNGIGVAPEDRQRIFEMFTQAWEDDRIEGTGIGLAICQSIVGRHGGRIWVEPVEGAGSRFTFFLPRTLEHSTRLQGSHS